MTSPFFRCAVLALLVGGAGGCASNASQKQYYTLHSEPASAVMQADAGQLEGGLGVGPIELPESFRGEGIASLGPQQQVFISQRHLWIGDLKKTISQTIAADLSWQLNYQDVWPYPWDTRHRPEKQISLLIEELGGRRGGEVAMTVKWILFEDYGSRAASIGRERFTAATENESYRSYVAAINDVVNQSSARLRTEVKQQWLTAQ